MLSAISTAHHVVRKGRRVVGRLKRKTLAVHSNVRSNPSGGPTPDINGEDCAVPRPAENDGAVEPEPFRYVGPDPHLSADELQRLTQLKGRFAGERIFVMGNGPSLNRMDLDWLDGENVFCVNRISLLFKRVTWRPKFFTAFDLRVVPDNLDEFNDLDIEYKFFATKHKGAILDRPNHIWYHDGGVAPDFSDRFSGAPEVTGFGGGGTVTCVAIQLAAHLGFDPIILIGCDASYSVPSTVKQVGPDKFGDGVKLNLESVDDDDANHFDPAYFGKGKRWHSPNATEMHIGFEKSFRQMREQGLTLVNATVGGALDSVPRVAYDRLFSSTIRRQAPIVVGIDLTHEMAAKPTGMRNSLLSTLRNTALLGADVRFVALCGGDGRRADYRQLEELPQFDIVEDRDADFASIVSSLDAILLPFNDIETALELGPDVRRIAYLNDLIPITQPGFPDFLKDRYRATADRADAILCLSEPTRSEIESHLGVDRDRCFVAPPAIDDLLTVDPASEGLELATKADIDRVRRQVGAKFTYLVYPAAYRPHKNHRALFEAMRYTYTNLQLVLTTGEAHDAAAESRIRQLIDEMQLGHRIRVAGKLAVEDYWALLLGSEALVFPSLDEGFGIPVAEAQAMRVPVIASRRGGLAEVALGSMEIDPTDHMDIANKITELTSDDDLKAAVIESGWHNSRRFTREQGAVGLISAVDFLFPNPNPNPN